ncbi:hypothetical protein CC80DRAFT_231727 [Byssothecium circinans]|uniref:Uncharacterized protein n=1 Tax=Byssothecium circinans TaxID=147558 RepID=A0A6A5U7N8_9PLEO|nr:hypothetical protein CC80DRAFT_231727 [Byssothecium circinans]
MQKATNDLKTVLKQLKAFIDDLATQTYGISSDEPSDLDHEVNDLLVKLEAQVCTLDENEARKQAYNDIVRASFELYCLPHCQGRLKSILGSSLANTLFPHIKLLAHPRRSFCTLIRAARTLECFSKVTIRSGVPAFGPTSPPTTPPPRSASTPLSIAHEKSKRIQNYEAAVESKLMFNELEKSRAEILRLSRTYLAPSDRGLGILQLSPPSKRYAFNLVLSIIAGRTPDADTDEYYAFGYPSVQEEKVLHLGGLFQEILLKTTDKVATFQSLWVSLEQNKLAGFFDDHSWSEFRTQLPGLERFLQNPVPVRESVYRLIQFTRSDSTDPTAWIDRDYGFHLCNPRDEVERLKDIYRELLKRIGPRQVHEACVGGQLRECVDAAGVYVAGKDRRLLQNRHYISGVGYEELGSYAKSFTTFYKRKLKRY